MWVDESRRPLLDITSVARILQMGGKEQRRGGREKGNYSSKERKKNLSFILLFLWLCKKFRKSEKIKNKDKL